MESITPKATYEALFVLDRRERFNDEMGVIWLPGLVPQSVLRDIFTVRLPSLARRIRRAARHRRELGRSAVAAEWMRELENGSVRHRSELARRVGLTRAGMTKALGGIA